MLLDKKNASVVVKIAAIAVAAAFVAAYIPSLLQGWSSAPTGSGPQQQQQGAPVDNKAADQRAATLRAQLAKDPKNFGIARELGDLYFDTGDNNLAARDQAKAASYYQLSAQAYEKALKLKPKDANVRTDMATVYFYSGNTKRAMKELDQVLAQQPNHANALFNLGVMAKSAKDTKTARTAWQRFLKIEPSGGRADKVRQDLAQLK